LGRDWPEPVLRGAICFLAAARAMVRAAVAERRLPDTRGQQRGSMQTLVKSLLERAIAAHGRGSTEEAKELYRRVLELAPRDKTANTNSAVIAAQEGDLAKAEELFRAALAGDPGYPAGYNNLGRLLQERGRLDEAVAAFGQAIKLKPQYAAALLNFGNALKLQGKLEQAIAAYRQAVAHAPHYPEAHNNLGVALQQVGRRTAAVAAYRRAIEINPNYVDAHYNLGVVLHEEGQYQHAIAVYHRVIELAPEYAEARNNLGIALRDSGCNDAAVAALRQAIRLKPNYAEAHYNLGIALKHAGSLDGAVAAYRRAIELVPNYAAAYNNLGLVLQEQGALEEAGTALSQAIRCQGDYAEAYNNLGAILHEQGRLDAAMATFEKALELKANYAKAHFNCANALRDAGRIADAIAGYRRALELNPRDPAAFSQLLFLRWRACDWTDYPTEQTRLLDVVRGASGEVPPFLLVATTASAADLLHCTREWVAARVSRPQLVLQPARAVRQLPIRLGYLSGDFHQHATATLAIELFERHDRGKFQVSAYAYGPNDHSRIRERLERAFDRFVDIRHMTHRQAAERIRDDGIDILVDLKGHTFHARPTILAHRPAPIQVNFLGFPGTTGADFIDYIIADRFVVPPDQQDHYSEKVVYLPDCYQPNDTKRQIAARVASRADCGLPENGFVFCCFNGSFKLTPTFFDVWMRLLLAVPDSVMWLLEVNGVMPGNLRREAAARGVDPMRLIFAPVVPLAEHLARHAHANLFLDTLPCNAHTTASDALWAGLPVLTLTGETFAGRVGASLLTAAGLPELIATSLADYAARALHLARHRDELTTLAARLGHNRGACPLFDIARLTRHLETAYGRMWERWQAGEQPEAIIV
jgi:protein O-GlcNAc transferase